MGTDDDVFPHFHFPEQANILKRTGDAAGGYLVRCQTVQRCAFETPSCPLAPIYAVNTLNTVVFPAPLGPMMLKISPSSTWKSTASTARRPPNCMDNPARQEAP